MSEDQLYLTTPVIKSDPMSRYLGTSCNVYLKLENLQPPGSFKIRGLSRFCQKAKSRGCKKLVCASGGNAGFAAAYAARKLGLPILIILPESTPGFVADQLKQEGADVLVRGKVWDNANSYAKECAQDPNLEYVHPFDHPDLSEGHSTLIDELAVQMPCKPDVIVTCVGGGGLLNGIIQGLQNHSWNDVAVVAMETDGADSFNAAVKAGHLVTLPDITSVAKCLGALTVSQTSLDNYNKHNIISEVIDDKLAIDACLKFAGDHRMIVEPACGATLAAVYSKILPRLQAEGKLGVINNVAVIVCGGSGVSIDLLQKWKTQFDL